MANGAKEKILEAADELFCTKGFAGVSVSDIAKRAGVKKASVFYHYGSKPELFELILERYYQAHARALPDPAETDAGVPERLHKLIDAYLDFIEDHHRYVRLVQLEIASGSERMPHIQKGLRLLYERVGDIIADVVPDVETARHLFISFSGIVNTYYVYAPVLGPMWGDDPLSASARRARREHVHWITDALLDKLIEDQS